MRRFLIGSAVAAFVLVGCVRSEAAVITFTNRGLWNGAAGSSTFNVDFSSFVADMEFRTAAVDVGPFSLQQGGAVQAFRNHIDVVPLVFTDNNGTAHASMFTEFDGPTFVDLTLDAPATAWGADFYDLSLEGVTLQLFNGAALIGTVALPAPPYTGFFGVWGNAGETITRVRFVSTSSIGGTGNGEGFGLDDVAAVSAVVPEPVTLLLLGAGLTGLARRRRGV